MTWILSQQTKMETPTKLCDRTTTEATLEGMSCWAWLHGQAAVVPIPTLYK